MRPCASQNTSRVGNAAAWRSTISKKVSFVQSARSTYSFASLGWTSGCGAIRWGSLAHAAQQAAVDLDRRPGDVAPERRDKVGDQVRDVLDLADAAHGDFGGELRTRIVGGEDFLQAAGVDVARADRIDADIHRRGFDGQG